MLGMYQRFFETMRWSFRISDESRDDKGGLRDASIIVEGPDCYKMLKYEAGIHRVQRVPATETQGRVHTSTVSVAVLSKPIKASQSYSFSKR